MSPARTTFRVDPKTARNLQRVLRVAPKALEQETRKTLRGFGIDWNRRMLNNFRRAANPGSEATMLQNRSGALRRSLGMRTSGQRLGDLRMRAFSAGVPYADIQEFGGTVQSSRANGYLTIPLEPMKTAAGVTRLSARALIQRDKLKEDGGKLFFYRSKAGNLFLAREKGRAKAKKVENLFLLKRQVTIPGPRNGRPSRFGFFREWRKLGPRREQQLRGLPRRAIARARQNRGVA